MNFESLLAATVRWASPVLLAGLLAVSGGVAVAKPWGKVDSWVLVGSTALGGCVMAKRFENAAFLSVTAVSDDAGGQRWEVLISDDTWSQIEVGATYSVDLLLVGSAQGPFRSDMLGFRAPMSSSMVSNALFAEFSEGSEFVTFMAEGIGVSTHLAFVLGGRMLGSYALEDAGAAFQELLRCYSENSRINA